MSGVEDKKDKTINRVLATCLALFLSALMLAVFHSSDLVSWSYDLPINNFTELVVGGVERWAAWMEDAGFTALSEKIGDWMQVLQDLSF